MSKTLSLLFSLLATAMLLATAFSISYNGWLALALGVLSIFMIGLGFVVKAKLRKKSSSS
jgi:hypothetical protein